MLEGLSESIRICASPRDRWLCLLKEREGGLKDMFHGEHQSKIGEHKGISFHGILDHVAPKSVNACLQCSASEMG